jgi:isopenicillin-N epimerase
MRLEGRWDLEPEVVYLNHGAFGAVPREVRAAQDRWRDRLEAGPVRFFDDLDGHFADARTTLARALGADPDGLAFVPNATTGVSTVLRALTFDPGDELLTTDHEYNATRNALAEVARRTGARIVAARIPFPSPSPDDALDAILAAVTPRTRLALVSHVTSPTALVLPIERIVAALTGRGIDTLVDAAHAPGMVEVDVDALGAAYWTGNGHKWLCGPKGSAVLWVREDRRAAVDPLVVSHGWNDERVARGERRAFRARFDWVGTGDPTPWLGLADAIGLVASLEPGGWPAIREANRRLVVEGAGIIGEALGSGLPAPDGMIGAMASLAVPWLRTDAEAEALHVALRADGIEVPVLGWPVAAAREPGEGPAAVLLRLSAQRYNEPADYERLAAALRSAASR